MLLRTKNCSLVERSGEQDGGGSRAGAGQGEKWEVQTSARGEERRARAVNSPGRPGDLARQEKGDKVRGSRAGP